MPRTWDLNWLPSDIFVTIPLTFRACAGDADCRPLATLGDRSGTAAGDTVDAAASEKNSATADVGAVTTSMESLLMESRFLSQNPAVE